MLTPLFCFIHFHHFADKVKIENCLFINKYTNNKLPSVFTNWFTFSSMSHNYQTLFASKGNLQIPSLDIIWKKCFCLYGYKNLELYSERNERCDVKHISIG